jgi:hypothetical protein
MNRQEGQFHDAACGLNQRAVILREAKRTEGSLRVHRDPSPAAQDDRLMNLSKYHEVAYEQREEAMRSC